MYAPAEEALFFFKPYCTVTCISTQILKREGAQILYATFHTKSDDKGTLESALGHFLAKWVL
jgi:hypothetical protein